jgi:hypothetical protein
VAFFISSLILTNWQLNQAMAAVAIAITMVAATIKVLLMVLPITGCPNTEASDRWTLRSVASFAQQLDVALRATAALYHGDNVIEL